MKKILLIVNLILLLTLSSCFPTYKLTNYFSNKVLKDCMVSDLVKPVDAANIDATSNTSITYETTYEGFLKNVSNVYEYLKSKDIVLGVQGEVLSSLFGGMPNYAFYDSACLEDHISINEYTGFKDENYYIFVWGNSIDEYNNLIDDVTLNMKYDGSKVTMYFKYGKNVLNSYDYKEERSYYIGTLLPWLNNNIKSITSVYDEDLISIRTLSYSTNDIYTIQPRNIVNEYKGEIENKWKITYQYETKDNTTYTVDIVDGYLLIDGKYYYGEYLYNIDDLRNYDLKTYTFLDDNLYDVYDHKNSNSITISLKDITYVKIDNSYYDDKYYINTSYGTIYIYRDNIFNLDGTYYQIISDKNFSDLFE